MWTELSFHPTEMNSEHTLPSDANTYTFQYIFSLVTQSDRCCVHGENTETDHCCMHAVWTMKCMQGHPPCGLPPVFISHTEHFHTVPINNALPQKTRHSRHAHSAVAQQQPIHYMKSIDDVHLGHANITYLFHTKILSHATVRRRLMPTTVSSTEECVLASRGILRNHIGHKIQLLRRTRSRSMVHPH